MSVKVAPVVRASIKSTISAVGTVNALNQAKVSAKIPGKLEKVLVEEGARVKAGQTLAKLEKTDFALTKNQAEAAVAVAEANFSKVKADRARAQELFERGIASQQQYDLAKSGYDIAEATVRQAKADLGLAQNQLDNADVTAPFAGTVTVKYCCLGERVAPGQPLFELADIGTVDIEVGVSDKRFSDVKLNQSATISVDGYPGREFTGKVKKIQPTIDPATRTFKVTIGIANSDELLKPGMFARTNIEVGYHTDALVIPKAALLEEEGKYLVVAVRDGRVKRMDAVPGFIEADKVEILSGPSEGEQVVIEGAYGLAQDALVKVSGE
ncbi:MAG: efflux RND transporter periplasmic adaptor subunit [Candidatus Lindowbacteria bacterium]|nr:efflux RND transporter periplasmic adaptor subunit [Candidatus Lindowbacteria bacterium]